MNKLIQELLLQSKNRNTGMVDEYKFAELIVKECVEYCGENLSRTVAGALKIHFGIEP